MRTFFPPDGMGVVVSRRTSIRCPGAAASPGIDMSSSTSSGTGVPCFTIWISRRSPGTVVALAYASSCVGRSMLEDIGGAIPTCASMR